jgi:hypothetical protein
MIDVMRHSRRGFIVGTLGVAGGLLLSKRLAAAGTIPDEPQLLLFDPQRTDACRWAAAAECRLGTQPIVGDRVRFARNLLSGDSSPDVFACLSGYADFILLSGCAAEARYRLLTERLHHVAAAETAAHGALVYWIAGRRRVSTFG